MGIRDGFCIRRTHEVRSVSDVHEGIRPRLDSTVAAKEFVHILAHTLSCSRVGCFVRPIQMCKARVIVHVLGNGVH